MYLIFRCDCGRVNYAKEGVMHRKCVCGKNLKVKGRRIIAQAYDNQEASEMVQELQEEIYGSAYFTTADKVK
jgi:hypothetical protein